MDQGWPDEHYEQAAASIALACLELLSDERRWIHRRVETIELLAQELVRRQVTVEFTLPRSLHDDLRVGADGPWCVPIALLAKRPLRNFDLRENDEWRAILGREHNAPIAASLVTAAARLAVAPAEVDPAAAALLESIALGDLAVAREALARLRAHGAASPQAAAILADDTAAYFVATFAESYMLLALLQQPHGRHILKYSYDEHLYYVRGRPRRHRLAQRLGWSPLVIEVAVPSAAHAASYHAEVVVPAELRLDAFVLDARSGELLSTDVERSVDRASLHAPDVGAQADPLLICAITAERAGVPTLALVISVVTAALLLVGATAGELRSPAAGSSVAVLLAGSVLFAAAVARGGEHQLARGVFAGPRWLLTVVAASALAAAAAVAFGAQALLRDVIWYAGGTASALACLSLAVAYGRAASLTRPRDERDASTPT